MSTVIVADRRIADKIENSWKNCRQDRNSWKNCRQDRKQL